MTSGDSDEDAVLFLLTPLREGRRSIRQAARPTAYFYSRPCGRGDGGRRSRNVSTEVTFLLTPLREGRLAGFVAVCVSGNFYSRPCGRGDKKAWNASKNLIISTHAPAGGATVIAAGFDAA